MKHELYPIKFQPILKDKIWGGEKLKTLLSKDTNLTNVGAVSYTHLTLPTSDLV